LTNRNCAAIPASVPLAPRATHRQRATARPTRRALPPCISGTAYQPPPPCMCPHRTPHAGQQRGVQQTTKMRFQWEPAASRLLGTVTTQSNTAAGIATQFRQGKWQSHLPASAHFFMCTPTRLFAKRARGRRALWAHCGTHTAQAHGICAAAARAIHALRTPPLLPTRLGGCRLQNPASHGHGATTLLFR